MKTLLLICLCASLAVVSFGQSITVGNGIDKSASPWPTGADYSFTQTIYLASEMATTGTISAIQFYFDSTSLSNSNKLTVFVGHTTKSSFADTADWVPLGGLTKVFDSTLTGVTLPGWVTIIFTTPFAYNGTDNLVIAIDENQPGHETIGGFYSLNYTGNRSLSLSSSSNIDSANPSSGILSSYAANIRMVGLQGILNQVGNFSHSFSVNSSGATYVTVKWREAATGTSPTGYNWELRDDTLQPGSNSNYVLSGTTNVSNITYPMSCCGEYRLYVRPKRGTGVYGPWSAAYTEADCTVYDLPYTIDFEGSYKLPPCSQSYFGSSDLNGIPWSVSSFLSSNRLMYCAAQYLGDVFFETPDFRLKKDSTYTFSYKHQYNGNSTDYFYSNLLDQMNNISKLIEGTGTEEFEYTPAALTYKKIKFHAVTSGVMGGCMYIDDLKVRRTTCGSPKNVKVINVTGNSATISWQPPTVGLAGSYSVTYNPYAGSYTTMNGVTDTFVNLTNLIPLTTYYYVITTTCGTNDKSVQSTGTFMTLCPTINPPYSEDFETCTVPDLPGCTSVENLNGKWETYNSYPGFTGKVLNFQAVTSASPSAWFYLRGLNLVAGTSYRISFKYGQNSTMAINQLDVRFGKIPSASAMTSILASYTVNSTTPQTATITFTPSATDTYYFGFYGKPIYFASRVFLDDITVMPSNSNLLRLSVFLDKNSNSIQEPGEPYFADANFVTTKAGVDTFVTHTNSGRCVTDIDTGKYMTTIQYYRPYYTAFPVSHTSNFTTYLNQDTAVFALQPEPGKRDLAVAIFSNSIARPGFDMNYQVICKNNGTDTVTDAVLKFVKPHFLNLLSALTSPTSVVADTMTWNLAALNPDTSQTIYLHFSIPAPPLVNAGDYLNSLADLSSGATDLLPQDNIFQLSQWVRGSYDPNDKTESHGGSIKLSDIQNNEYLQYTIRFQNTGNDTAFNVHVEDTLSSLLDYNSLKMVSASANYKLVISDGNKLLWTFNDIKLVDSNANEPASHGYIVYRVKAKTTVSIGDIITNSASIRFDYNLPVRTNTDSCIVTGNILPLNLLSFIAHKKDKTNVLDWAASQLVNFDRFEIERSGGNGEFMKIGKVKNSLVGVQEGNYRFTDNTPLNSKNYYRLKLIDKDVKFAYSPVRLIDNSSTFSVTVQPNPSKNNFNMLVHGTGNELVQIRITDANGRVVGQLKYKADQSFTFGSGWAPGVYLIEAKQGDERRSVKAVKIK